MGGFALWDALGTSEAITGALAYELYAIGATNVKASRNAMGNLVLEFDWKHPDEKTVQHRTLILMAGDITQPAEWPRELVQMLAQRPIATYSHNAGSTLPSKYASDSKNGSYIQKLYQHLGLNGLMLTDDYAVFGSSLQRVARDYAPDLDSLGMKPLEVEGFAAIRDEIHAVKRTTFGTAKPNAEMDVLLDYGWHQRVRQKTEATAGPNASGKITQAAGA